MKRNKNKERKEKERINVNDLFDVKEVPKVQRSNIFTNLQQKKCNKNIPNSKICIVKML